MSDSRSLVWLRLNSDHKKHTSQRLLDADLDPELTVCPFCGCNFEKALRLMQLQCDPDIFRMQCAACGCTYVNRMPTDQYLAKHYANYYEDGERRTHINTSRLSRQLAKAMRSKPSDGLRILDFGGGDGGVALDLIQEIGCKSSYVAVVDYNTVPHPSPPAGAVIEHFRSVAETRQLPGFNLVIASAVLEHVKPLRETLVALLNSLAPGGTFYARTPYCVPLHRAIRWAGVEFDTNYPAHLYDLGSRFWDDCIKTLKLESELTLAASRPSLVGSDWFQQPFVTLVATLLKSPWYIVGNHYSLVGGWEVFINR